MQGTAELSRHDFLTHAVAISAAASLGVLLSGCTAVPASEEADANRPGSVSNKSQLSALDPLPPAEPNPDVDFNVDKNVNIEVVDGFLDRDDVVYRDMRMFFDSAEFASVGGSSDLADVLEGFLIVPYPYLGTLSQMPIEGAYTGNTLFSVVFDDKGGVTDVQENYVESQMIINELFPKDKAVFLVCGAGGYAAMAKSLLIFLGWDADKIYNLGGMWGYKGSRIVKLIEYSSGPDGTDIYATWRADYASLDFSRMHPVSHNQD
jgi:rhodanese-related sulfurtransferase